MLALSVRSSHKSLIPIALTLGAYFIQSASSTPEPFSLTDWVHGQFNPEPGDTPETEIQCYALPYGGFGTLSHILTYYTLLCVAYGRRPLMPWEKENMTGFIRNILIAFLSSVGTIVPAGFTMASCRNSWAFVLLGVWKLMLAACANIAVLTQVNNIRSHKPLERRQGMVCMLLYVVGSFLGLIGLISIVSGEIDKKDVMIVTFVFAIILGVWFIGAILIFCCSPEIVKEHKFPISCVFLLSCAFYADWALAAVTGNWVGAPSDDTQVLYWIYFAAKRLLMLTW